MGSNNIQKIIVLLGKHVTNLNYTLKSIKLDDIIDFICFDYKGPIIIANKDTLPSDLSTVERYFKNTEFLDSNGIQYACLSQSKSYLKILGKLYNIKGTNTSISLSVVETIIKTTYIFDNIHIVSVTNFIQLISPQPVDRFSQTKLCWKTPNEGYPHICGMYKSNNERLRYQAISSCKSFVC